MNKAAELLDEIKYIIVERADMEYDRNMHTQWKYSYNVKEDNQDWTYRKLLKRIEDCLEEDKKC